MRLNLTCSVATRLAIIWLGVFLVGCGGAGTTRGTLTKTLARDGLMNSVGGLRLFDDYSISTTAAMGPPVVGGPFFDGNLYYTFAYSGNQTTISYYTDAGATNPAGTIVLTGSGGSYTAVIDIIDGDHPAHGTLTFTQVSGDHNSFRLVGNLTTPIGPNSDIPVTWSFDLMSSGWTLGTLTGSYSASVGGQSVSFDNVVQTHVANTTIVSERVRFEPSSVSTPLTFTITNSDGSATLTVADGTIALVSSLGSGSIAYPDGASDLISDFFRGV